MGSGSSCTEVHQIDRTTQVPSLPDVRPRPIRAYEPMFTLVPKPTNRRIYGQEEAFELDNNMEEYEQAWGSDNKLAKIFRRSPTAPGLQNVQYPVNENANRNSNKKISTNLGSARVESVIDSQTELALHLKSSDKIDELFTTLNNVHKQLDGIIKRRTEQISTETENVLSHIRNETQEKEHRLLTFAKSQQMKQDENYQNSLKEYLAQLDQMKAKELDELQRQLQVYREQIIEESQLKITTVNEQANIIKAKVVQEEQNRSTEEIETIISQLQRVSFDEKLQNLSAEITTKTNIITNAKVGR